MKFNPTLKVREVKQSISQSVVGWILTLPLVDRQIFMLPEKSVHRKVRRAGKMSQRLGVEIVGTDSHISLSCNTDKIIGEYTNAPVLRGDSFTLLSSIEVARKAVISLGYNMGEVPVVVYGADSLMGTVCSQLIARETRKLILVGKHRGKLKELANKILFDTGLSVKISTTQDNKFWHLGGVVFLACAPEVRAQSLPQKVVICQLAGNLLDRSLWEQQVIVIDSAVVEVPKDLAFKSLPGFPPGTVNPSLAETMLTAMGEKCFNDSFYHSSGVAHVDDINCRSKENGYKTVGFLSNNKFFPI